MACWVEIPEGSFVHSPSALISVVLLPHSEAEAAPVQEEDAAGAFDVWIIWTSDASVDFSPQSEDEDAVCTAVAEEQSDEVLAVWIAFTDESQSDATDAVWTAVADEEQSDVFAAVWTAVAVVAEEQSDEVFTTSAVCVALAQQLLFASLFSVSVAVNTRLRPITKVKLRNEVKMYFFIAIFLFDEYLFLFRPNLNKIVKP